MAKKKPKIRKQIVFKRVTPSNLSRKDFAAMLYKERTKAELLMSDKLTDASIVFEEQVIIGAYVVDFLLRDCSVVIEVDGGYHLDPEQQEKDATRTKYLNSIGLRVIRVLNKNVKKCNVVKLITPQENKAKQSTPQKWTPPPVKPKKIRNALTVSNSISFTRMIQEEKKKSTPKQIKLVKAGEKVERKPFIPSGIAIPEPKMNRKERRWLAKNDKH